MPQRAATGSGQDWAPQVFNVNKGGPQTVRPKTGEKAANAALRSGGSVEVSKKMTSGNTNHAGPGANAKKMDEDHETLKHKTISNALRAEIQKQRQAKGWNQHDFATRVNERESLVKEYENGKAIPNEQILVKMEKAFGVHLRGAKIGEVMEPKKTKAQLAKEKEEKEAAAKKLAEDKARCGQK